MAMTQCAHHIGLTVPEIQHLMVYIPGGIRLELVAHS